MIVMPGILRGRRTLFDGFVMDLMSSTFRATVPTAQTRTFQETHVYTGGPKLGPKANGNLGWNRHNYLPQTNTFSSTTWTHGTFTVSTDGTLDPYGNVATKVTRTATGSTFAYTSTGAGSADGVTLKVLLKKPAGASEMNAFGVRNNTSATNIYLITVNWSTLVVTEGTGPSDGATTITQISGDWYEIELKVSPATPIPPGNNITVYLGASGGSGTAGDAIYFSQPMLHRGVTTLPYLENRSTTVPYLDEPTVFNSSGVRQGIVLEPAATNLALASQDFGNATYWTTSTAAVVANAETAPDGTLTADKLNETAGVFTHYVVQSPTLTAAVHTSSYYVKPAERTWCWLRTTGGVATYFNLSGSGAVGTLGHTSATIEALPNGWYRCAIVWTATVGGSIGIGPATADNTNNYDGVAASGIYVWGSQTELGTVATSYIPTTTASVTRTADTCYRVLGPEWNATAASLYTDFTPYNVADAPTFSGISDGTANNRIITFISSNAREYAVTGGVVQANTNTSVATVLANGSRYRHVKGFATNDIIGAINGNIGTQDTSITLPAVTRLDVASSPGSTSLNGIIHSVRLYSSRLSDANMQSLTTAGVDPTSPTLDFNYETGVYTYTPVNAGVTTNYSLSTLISSGLMTLTGTPSAKWVRGSNGFLTEVAAGSLAIEYDVNGNVLGCINTEPARTNSEPRSNTSTWPAFQATSTDLSSEVNPTGGTGGVRKLAATATSGVHSNYNGVAATAAPWTSSIFAKAAELSWIKVRCDNGTSTGAWFNLSTGEIGTVESGVTAKIEQFANGWYRCSASRTLTATTGYNSIELAITDGSTSYDGAANPGGVLIWGAQFEAGSYASSHIPTAGAAVTRNADVWTLNLGSWFDNSKWVVASKVYAPRANMTAGSVTPAIWSLNLATPATTDYVTEWLSSTNRIDFHERTSSTDRAVGNATTLSFPATVKSAFGYSPSNTLASLNGSTQTLTGTPSPTQAPFTLMRIGDSERSNVDQGSVYIQAINILPVVPTQDNVNQYAQAV